MAQAAGALLSVMYPIALSYARVNLSVIPVEEKRKDPSFLLLTKIDDDGVKAVTWSQYQQKIATPEKMLSWWTATPRANVAIVCGEVSGNLVVWDVDDQDFCRWLEDNVSETILKKTWTVRTGSGKLHIYMRTTGETGSTVITDKNGKRLLDLRAKGWYVLAPPSVHPTGGVYTTLYGSPDRIAGISNLSSLLTRVVDSYNTRVRPQAQASSSSGKKKPMLLPVGRMTQVEADALIKKLNAGGMAKRMTKALSEGARAGVGHWSSTVSNSEIDFIVMKEMTRNGMSRAEIQRAYDYFPLGLNCYRNPARSNHGQSYLFATLDNVDKALAAAMQALLHTAGDNFRIMHSIRLLSEPPIFYTTLRNYDTQEDELIRMEFNDWASEHAFKQSVFRQVPRLVPQMGSLGGKDFIKFVSLVALMCDIEDVPPEAKLFGVTKAQVLHILKERLSDFTPTSAEQINLGWIDRQRDYAAFRSRVLMSILSMQNKQTPEAGRVWEIIRGWGGIDKAIPIGGILETFWLLSPSRIGL